MKHRQERYSKIAREREMVTGVAEGGPFRRDPQRKKINGAKGRKNG